VAIGCVHLIGPDNKREQMEVAGMVVNDLRELTGLRSGQQVEEGKN
jgi:hypothetical protein